MQQQQKLLPHSNPLDAAEAGRSQLFGSGPVGEAGKSSEALQGLGKFFGDLKVRRKFMILHNLFFIVLAGAVYFSLIRAFESRVSGARVRETSLVAQMFAEGKPLPRLPGMEIYEYREGTADALGVPVEARFWLDANPGATWQRPEESEFLYRKDPQSGLFRKLRLPNTFYDRMVNRAKWALFLVLGVIYVLAVLLLERVIMPLYVYRPLKLMLGADQATRCDDRDHELIDPRLIPGDEIGQIMASRNATVAELRRQEEELAKALARLEEVNEDLKQKNQLLETAKKKLADQDRLVSLGLLSASVAHEMNTPLSVLHGSIEKLIETVDDDAAQDRLARILRVTERLRRISESLLDFARVRKHDFEPVPIRPIIEEAWGLVAIDEKAAGAHFVNRAASDHVVIGNADRLVQVFVNLLRNSLNAIKSTGSISVQSRRLIEDGQPWIAVSIEDDGSGIPEDVLPDIFEAFVTSRLDARGTGLGLTVAEGIVHQHGGTIAASNRPGGGARLEVMFPAAAEQKTEARRRNAEGGRSAL